MNDIVLIAKKMLTAHGRLEPKLVIEGSTELETVPLPDLPEQAKLSVLEALGYTLASEGKIGHLEQIFLVAEGWRGTRNGPHAALRPQHDPNRVESLMVFHYQAKDDSRQMTIYDMVRNERGELIELKALPTSNGSVPGSV